MATPPAFPNSFKYRMIFDLGAGFSGGVGGYFNVDTSPLSASQMDLIATGIRTSFAANLASFMTTAFSLTSVTVRDLTAGGGEGSDSTAVPGTDANTGLGVDTCALVNLEVFRTYRGGKPRIYWPFGTNTSLENDHEWTDAFVSSLNAAMAAFDSAISGGSYGGAKVNNRENISYYGGFKVVTSPTTGRARNVPQYRGTPGFDPIIPPDAVTGYSTQKFIGTQRRRVRSTGG